MVRILHQLARRVVAWRNVVPTPVYNGLRRLYRLRHPGHPAARAYVGAVAQNIPLAPDRILYESFHGKSFNCSPAAICLQLLDDPAYTHLTHVWAVNDPSVLPAKLVNHPRVRWVKRRTAEYGLALASCGKIITNTTLEPYFFRRIGQTYANTWHGVPLKRMFRHEGAAITRHANSQRNFLQASHVLMPNRYTAEALMGSADVAQAVEARVTCVGAPRVDLTLAPDADALRAQLGIGAEVQVLMVAPTWRGTIGAADDMPQIDALLDRLNTLDPDRYAVFVQMHDFVATPNTRARAVPDGVTTNQFLSVVDTLITDYSSIMFDFFATGRQVILFAYDLEDYAATRGLIADLTTLPAQVCRDADSVIHAVHSQRRSDADPRYAAARELYFGLDDGQATARAITAIWTDPDPDPTPQRPRIVVFAGAWKNNGITSSATNLLGALAGYDVDVYLVTNGYEIDRTPDYAANIRRVHPSIHILHRTGEMAHTPEERADLDAFYKDNTLRSPQQEATLDTLFAREARRMFGDMTFDVAIDFSGYARFWALLIAHTPARRHVIYQHNDMRSEADIRFDILNGVFAAYKYYDAVVSVSPATRALNFETLGTYYKHPDASLSVRNMIDPQRILQAAAAPLPEDIDLPASPTRFVSVGRLSGEKAQDRMITAIATLRAQGHDVELMLIGDGPLHDSLVALTHKLGVDDHIIFAGHRPNPFAIMARCDCFVLSSDYEGQPMVLLEALTLGLPIVATDIAGARSVLDRDQSALVPPSTDGVTQGMHEFMTNARPALRFDGASYCDDVMQEFIDRVIAQPIARKPAPKKTT